VNDLENILGYTATQIHKMMGIKPLHEEEESLSSPKELKVEGLSPKSGSGEKHINDSACASGNRGTVMYLASSINCYLPLNL